MPQYISHGKMALPDYNKDAMQDWGLHSRLRGSNVGLWDEIFEFNKVQLTRIVTKFECTLKSLNSSDRENQAVRLAKMKKQSVIGRMSYNNT